MEASELIAQEVAVASGKNAEPPVAGGAFERHLPLVTSWNVLAKGTHLPHGGGPSMHSHVSPVRWSGSEYGDRQWARNSHLIPDSVCALVHPCLVRLATPEQVQTALASLAVRALRDEGGVR